ncbi:heavy metal translocating P-type ATPase [Culicoidibacter larvae]|uniref:Cd(2+)-exporting ATPase n=1 Tax=Culicoidibacter larvae TaxID=2579976 RepID=A0A5R8QAS4_9FIRM|nr:cadmium-translocating P-type ATPase [Culicoidibacter larvae]
METKKQEFELKNLDCANCGSKIENQGQKIDGIDDLKVNFVNQKMTVVFNDDADTTKTIGALEKLIHKLEPDVVVSAMKTKKDEVTAEKNEHLKSIIQLIVGGLLFAVPMIFELPFAVELTMYIISYLVVGGEVVLRAGKNILRGQVFDENFLMTIATLGAFAIGEYPEAVAVMLFYQVGELFQDMAVANSRKSITALMDIRPDFAHVKVGDDYQTVAPDTIAIGNIIRVLPGEKVPLDGVVLSGHSALDTSALTGESLPRSVKPGDDVISGCINKNGVLEVEVSKVFAESTVSKILDLVQNASDKKAPTENFITKFARYYTPAVVIIAVLLAVVPPLVIPGASFFDWLNRALVFLVISCPCALVISIPLGFFGGIGAASKRGVLVKGSNYLEALNNVDTLVFDKTGTLTKGNFAVTEVISAAMPEEELMAIAAHAESLSTHPIAQSIVASFSGTIDENRVSNYQEIAGRGLQVTIDGKNVLAGNARLMSEHNIVFDAVDSIGTVVYVAVNDIYSGALVIADELKSDSKAAIARLKQLGVKTIVMLTGDNKKTAESVAAQIGITDVRAELLPDGKVEQLEAIEANKAEKSKVAFVGDGINDAPVLARADVGIAMGGLGSDAAIEAADVVLMSDEPSQIADAIDVAKFTRKIVWQNIIFALTVKGIFLLLGAFGIATMWEAVFADVGVSVIAILNAMRVMRIKK